MIFNWRRESGRETRSVVLTLYNSMLKIWRSSYAMVIVIYAKIDFFVQIGVQKMKLIAKAT